MSFNGVGLKLGCIRFIVCATSIYIVQVHLSLILAIRSQIKVHHIMYQCVHCDTFYLYLTVTLLSAYMT